MIGSLSVERIQRPKAAMEIFIFRAHQVCRKALERALTGFAWMDLFKLHKVGVING